jgi:hypothetical protein
VGSETRWSASKEEILEEMVAKSTEIDFLKSDKTSLKASPENSHSALQTCCEEDGLSTGALADEPSTDVLTTQGVVLGYRCFTCTARADTDLKPRQA